MDKVAQRKALINALLLAIVMAMPSGLSFEELEYVNALYADTTSGYYAKFTRMPEWSLGLWRAPVTFSTRVNYFITLGVSFLSFALLSTLISFWVIGNLDLSEDRKIPVHFWAWFRWVAFVEFIMTVLNVVFSYIAYMTIIEVKFPDPTYSGQGESEYYSIINSPHSFTYLLVTWFCYAAVIFATLGMSMALKSSSKNDPDESKSGVESKKHEV